MLHYDGTFGTYHKFFSHIKCALDAEVDMTELAGSKIVLGSDEEKALTKPPGGVCFPMPHTYTVFPPPPGKCSTILARQGWCTRAAKVFYRCTSFWSQVLFIRRMNMISKIWSWSWRVLLKGKFQNSPPTWQNHSQHKTVYVRAIPYRKVENNACASMNHILKSSVNWKTTRVPDLCDKLHDIVKLQYLDMRRALHGSGNYELAPHVGSLRVNHTVWHRMTDSEKDALFQNCCWEKHQVYVL